MIDEVIKLKKLKLFIYIPLFPTLDVGLLQLIGRIDAFFYDERLDAVFANIL